MMLISTAKFTYVVYSCLLALLKLGSAQQVFSTNNFRTNNLHGLRSGSFVETPRAIRASSTHSSTCFTPQQPANGGYKLDKHFCQGNIEDCSVTEGVGLEPGYQLVYSCKPGFEPIGRTDVFCRFGGTWSPIPFCVEVTCNSLNSASTAVSCTLLGEWVNCESSVPPGTRAQIACRPGYKKDTDVLSPRSRFVRCNNNGTWEPNPIRCVPACGQVVTSQKPLAFGATPANISEFPWHASLFVERNGPAGKSKDFTCGGTIIQANLVLTAAHCVYDETTRTATDPAKLFVMTGNIFRDYDSPFHNPEVVRKAAIKNLFIDCSYYGLLGNYASDVALLELQQPFAFSSILSPACLDDSDNSDQFLEPGVSGKVAGFGRTASSSTSFHQCENGRDCNIPEGTTLELGSQLVYSCVGEFTMNGTTDVYCKPGGSWTTIPTCTGALGDGRGEIARSKCREFARSIKLDNCPRSILDNGAIIYDLTPNDKVRANNKEFPHMAVIGFNSSDGTVARGCAGTLISESFVLTGAACLQGRSSDQDTWVRMGNLKLEQSDDGAMPEQRRVIEEILHPNFTLGLASNNIGLLRLETPVRFNSWVRPACLHTSPTVETKEAIIAGWGCLRWEEDELSPNLAKVVVPIVNWQICNTGYSVAKGGLPYGVTERANICAGVNNRRICFVMTILILKKCRRLYDHHVS